VVRRAGGSRPPPKPAGANIAQLIADTEIVTRPWPSVLTLSGFEAL